MSTPANVLALPTPADHPAYAGHFPGRPILPGVLLLDEAIHALAARHGLAESGAQIKSAKFTQPVGPDEALALRFTETAPGSFRFEIEAGGRGVANGAVAFDRG